jgi:hypothetical protein
MLTPDQLSALLHAIVTGPPVRWSQSLLTADASSESTHIEIPHGTTFVCVRPLDADLVVTASEDDSLMPTPGDELCPLGVDKWLSVGKAKHLRFWPVDDSGAITGSASFRLTLRRRGLV